jgi:hypothetical protein
MKKATTKKTVSSVEFEEFSNIITPPDFVKNKQHSVVIVDPEWTEVEDVAFYLKTSKRAYNVYVYRSEMNNEEWLSKVKAKTLHIIVNTINNDGSTVKDKLAVSKNAFYYGPKNFLMNKNKIEKPIDYFINLEK